MRIVSDNIYEKYYQIFREDEIIQKIPGNQCFNDGNNSKVKFNEKKKSGDLMSRNCKNIYSEVDHTDVGTVQ